jgi:hypothetical protein
MEMQQLIQQAAQDPRFQQALQVAQAELSDASPEQIEELIQLFELMLQKPEEYQAILQAAIQDDMVEPEDMPQEFDATVIASALVVLYKLREGGGQVQMFARGGLAGMRTLARQGRMGDTMMAHISPEEAEMLKARGGAGTINPQTGYPQYFSLKKLFKAILPIALNFIAPGLGSAIGSAVGLSGAAATAFGGAIIGGASSALTGGNALQGALMGGLGGGLGNVVGGAANKMLGLNLGQGAQSILGSGLVGGAAGAATGQGFLKGLGQGVLGGAVGQLAGSMSGPTAFQQGLGAAGQTFGQALTAGYDPKSALVAGGLSGLATGLSYKPSDAAVTGLRGGQQPEAPANQPAAPGTQPTFFERISNIFGGGDAAGGGGSGSFGTLGKLALAGSALSGLLSAPPEVKQAASTLSPEQQEYFNRPSITWDWNKMQRDANASGMSLSQFMASNWNNITSGQYNAAPAAPAPAPAANAMPATAMAPPAMAHGGRHMMANGGSPLSAVARFARGAGTGRSDEIDAKLSDGESVIDAETVAMLGDGSSKAGAQRLDEMRKQIRSHKGKALAKGKFSPDAKSPLAYIKGVA